MIVQIMVSVFDKVSGAVVVLLAATLVTLSSVSYIVKLLPEKTIQFFG